MQHDRASHARCARAHGRRVECTGPRSLFIVALVLLLELLGGAATHPQGEKDSRLKLEWEKVVSRSSYILVRSNLCRVIS